MAYVAGTATSVADLLTALQSACTANGWALSGTILSKGACYMQVKVVGGYLTVLGGTGNAGSDTLASPATPAAALGQLWAADPFAFPLTYEINVHTAPDEVYVVVNYAVDRYQWLAFGCSPAAALPGTGNWFGASLCRAAQVTGISMSTSQGGWNNFQAPALFWQTSATNFFTGVLHHGLDGLTWSAGAGGGVANAADALPGATSLLSRQPNNWNGEVVLLPIQPCVARPSSKVSMVGDLGHARYLRNDNLAAGDIITLGPDRWKAYPWYRKNSAARDGAYSTALDHSGTLGWAIRYTGP